MRIILLLLLTLFVSHPMLAQKQGKPLGKTPAVLTNDSYVQLGGNNMTMWLSNNGSISHSPLSDASGLEWPAASGRHVMYEDGFVIGARQSGTLHIGGSTYVNALQAGNILASGQASNPGSPIHRVYHVGDYTSQEFAHLSSAQQSAFRIDFLEWPVDLGAPWIDGDSNGRYEPDFDAWMAGTPGTDKPDFRGKEMCWYVSNDLDGARAASLYGTMPMGIEVQVLAWTGTGDPVSENTIYVSFTMINKGTADLTDCYIGRWADPDVGDAFNDLVGIDTSLVAMYAYNGEPLDDIYDMQPPAVGVIWLQTAIAPAMGSRARYGNGWREGYRNVPLSSFAFYINGDPDYQDPELGSALGAPQMYNYLSGRLYDGSAYIDPTTSKATRFPLTGDPGTGLGWVDGLLHEPGDRRMLSACGPFTVAVGDTQQVVCATSIGTGVTPLLAVQQLLDNAYRLRRSYQTMRPMLALTDTRYQLSWPAEDAFELTTYVQAEAGQNLEAILRAPGSTELGRFPLRDDGQHGDGAAGDGLYAGLFTHAAFSTGADLIVALTENGEIRNDAIAARMLPLVGEIRLNDLRVVSDHMDFNGEASPGENIIVEMSLENRSTLALGPWNLSMLVAPEATLISRYSPVIQPGNSEQLNGLQDSTLHALRWDVPENALPNTTFRVPVHIIASQYCQWNDTLELPIHELSRPMFTGELFHEEGPAVGTLGYVVSDPDALNGHLLRITVEGRDTENKTLTVRDITDGVVLHSGIPVPDRYGHFSPEIAGIHLCIGSTYGDVVLYQEGWTNRALKDPLWEFEHPDRTWFSPYAGYLAYGDQFFGTSLYIFDTYPVLLVFDRNAQSKGYMYLQGGSPNYAYDGYYESPLRVYDMSDSSNPRQISYAFVERSGSASNDMSWFPTASPADREYLIPLDLAYTESPNPAYTSPLDVNAYATPMLYLIWPLLNAQSGSFQDGDRFWIHPQLPMSERDSYLLDLGQVSSVGRPAQIPQDVELHQNYPNPFTASTTLAFTLRRPATVTLSITDALGRQVRRIVDGESLVAGMHVRAFASHNLPPGIYFARVTAGERTQVKRMLLLR
ncbi:T9SS type A sorting domain-containing protein [bacterium]|nr:T9SS type A sorting domain-containing protein [bacterium]